MAHVYPFGQFFGGRSVRAGGVAGVAVAPEARGRGHAQRVMRASIADQRVRGEANSILDPATTSLYG